MCLPACVSRDSGRDLASLGIALTRAPRMLTALPGCWVTLSLCFSDISSDIRVICMGELGCWIRLYPDMFLDNNYLKYIGWMLYDKVRAPAALPPPPRSPQVRRAVRLVRGASTCLPDGFSPVLLCEGGFPRSSRFVAVLTVGDRGFGLSAGEMGPWPCLHVRPVAEGCASASVA